MPNTVKLRDMAEAELAAERALEESVALMSMDEVVSAMSEGRLSRDVANTRIAELVGIDDMETDEMGSVHPNDPEASVDAEGDDEIAVSPSKKGKEKAGRKRKASETATDEGSQKHPRIEDEILPPNFPKKAPNKLADLLTDEERVAWFAAGKVVSYVSRLGPFHC